MALSEQSARSKLGQAANRFLASMTITHDMWHDGTGYDLGALDATPAEERAAIEAVLLAREPKDWRDIEALARFDTPLARQAVQAALQSSDPQVRRQATQHATEKPDPKEREKLLVAALRDKQLYGGLSEAIDEAAEFHPPAVIDALLRGALNRDGEAAVHFVALLYFLHGKAEEPFDWNHRPFFLKFDTADRTERISLFHELCHIIGVDPLPYVTD